LFKVIQTRKKENLVKTVNNFSLQC